MENIIENNKLLAQFLGGYEPEEYEDFHSDWNRLMEVVNNIECLGYDSRIHGNYSDGGFLCDFVDFDNEEVACQISYVSKIDAVYKSCIEFIEYWNQKGGK